MAGEQAEAADPGEARSFAILLASLEEGQLNQDLTDQVRDIVARLHDVERDQGGSPAATLTVKLNFKLDGGVIELNAEHAAKLPKEVRGKSVFWATPNNNLTRRNPRQRELPLRDVSTTAPEVRAV